MTLGARTVPTTAAARIILASPNAGLDMFGMEKRLVAHQILLRKFLQPALINHFS